MTLSDRLLGIVGGAMVLAALVLLVVGGEGDSGAAGGGAQAPRIEMVSPMDGAVVDGPLEVVFRMPGERPLEMGPGGWGVGDHHIHLEMDGVELMPAATDIERVADDRYRWSLRAPRPGPHELRLLWSGLDHRPIPETATELVRVEVR